ncbi:uncharacterized protein PITG_07668 [Phytophthora infestans T30-4]|uniref:Uncharacterized protein n=1 Tax=Phytophthora infestans (strain T30-4) TaxID=403677 RepID=D0N8V0_PHYIT|nr:uncharacterized protein PITG_07668 [Phytophthora infestans T30-4]EEY53985.1 conserved hypothetical protein [Phytophthora infestans T30-4]|eukprot:XP_002904616.1 conserved hypothetical protein [Phytophthora infestans T30-4]
MQRRGGEKTLLSSERKAIVRQLRESSVPTAEPRAKRPDASDTNPELEAKVATLRHRIVSEEESELWPGSYAGHPIAFVQPTDQFVDQWAHGRVAEYTMHDSKTELHLRDSDDEAKEDKLLVDPRNIELVWLQNKPLCKRTRDTDLTPQDLDESLPAFPPVNEAQTSAFRPSTMEFYVNDAIANPSLHGKNAKTVLESAQQGSRTKFHATPPILRLAFVKTGAQLMENWQNYRPDAATCSMLVFWVNSKPGQFRSEIIISNIEVAKLIGRELTRNDDHLMKLYHNRHDSQIAAMTNNPYNREQRGSKTSAVPRELSAMLRKQGAKTMCMRYLSKTATPVQHEGSVLIQTERISSPWRYQHTQRA